MDSVYLLILWRRTFASTRIWEQLGCVFMSRVNTVSSKKANFIGHDVISEHFPTTVLITKHWTLILSYIVKHVTGSRSNIEPPPPFSWRSNPYCARACSCRGFTIAPRHTTLGRTSLDEWSARCRYLYLTTRNAHKRQASMPPAGSQQASVRRPTPKAAQPLWSVISSL
jgi:hypothetical protein